MAVVPICFHNKEEKSNMHATDHNFPTSREAVEIRQLPSLSLRRPARAASMLLRCSPPRRLHLLRPHHLRLLSAAALASAAPAQSPTDWAEAPIASVRPATADSSLFHVSLDLSAHQGLLASHAAAGQFLPFRLPATPYPIFLAIASPPPATSAESSFDFLVKRLPGTPSARLCDLCPGDLVHVGASVVGSGFEVAKIAEARQVLVFATGSGIRYLTNPAFLCYRSISFFS